MVRTGGPKVAHALLFDRLSDPDIRQTRESAPRRTYDRAELLESIRREVSQLFNTRCAVPAPDLAGRTRSVLDYGIPDLSYFSPANQESDAALQRILRETLQAFEPRLLDPVVSIERLEGRHQRLVVQIGGMIRLGAVREPVSFAVALEDSGSRAGAG